MKRRLEDAIDETIKFSAENTIEKKKKSFVGLVLSTLFKKLFTKWMDDLLPALIESIREAIKNSEEIDVRFKE